MELNENRIYSNINRIEKKLIKIANEHPKIQSNAKFKNSRNIFSKNKNKSSLNFGINKNFISNLIINPKIFRIKMKNYILMTIIQLIIIKLYLLILFNLMQII